LPWCGGEPACNQYKSRYNVVYAKYNLIKGEKIIMQYFLTTKNVVKPYCKTIIEGDELKVQVYDQTSKTGLNILSRPDIVKIIDEDSEEFNSTMKNFLARHKNIDIQKHISALNNQQHTNTQLVTEQDRIEERIKLKEILEDGEYLKLEEIEVDDADILDEKDCNLRDYLRSIEGEFPDWFLIYFETKYITHRGMYDEYWLTDPKRRVCGERLIITEEIF